MAKAQKPDALPDTPPTSHREGTDESLRKERRAADVANAQPDPAEDDADRIVDVARDRADAVLAHARDVADDDRDASGSPDEVAQYRAVADEVLQDERDAADDLLRLEREDSARVLSASLPLSRRRTDLKLLTERVSHDDALLQRDDFLGMVSHDLNNLLLGIVLSAGSVGSYASKLTGGERVVVGVGRIQVYAARMKRLIGDLTDVTSLSAGNLGLTAAPYDAVALVAEALVTFRQIAAEKRISLKGAVADGPLVIACDAGRVLQVLANLLGNAIKFTSEGGSVSAGVVRSGDDVRFSVVDTGPGIPEDLVEAVFERFWQAGKDERRGLGLGLYIAKGIVEAHGGRIWAESRLGEGASLHFTLPMRGGAQAGMTPRPS